jgi:D-3-phosphoglycerate dehydrogenase
MEKISLALAAGVLEPYLERIKQRCEITFFGARYGEAVSGEAMLRTAMGHSIVYVAGEVVTEGMIAAWKGAGLRLLGCGRGTPVNVDHRAAKAHGIPLVYTPGRNAESVAEYTFGLMLALIRRIAPSYHALRNGSYLADAKDDIYAVDESRQDVVWRMADGTSPMRQFSGGFDLFGRTLGLIGFGAIGSRVARIALGFGMEVKVYDPYCPEERIEEAGAIACGLNETLSSADVVSIHLPVTPQTRGIVDASWFARMRPDAYFINSARASVVDQRAMVEALQNRRIAGAAVDVMWDEPCPKNHPFLTMDNVVVTTHLAGMSVDVDKWQSQMIADEILRFCDGLPPKLVWTRTD